MKEEQEALKSPDPSEKDFTLQDLTQPNLAQPITATTQPTDRFTVTKVSDDEDDLSQLDFDLQYFKRLYKLTVNQMAVLVREADRQQNLIATAKTAPKRELYTKKFNKTKGKFQDELARLMQIKHILDENNVDLEALRDEDEE